MQFVFCRCFLVTFIHFIYVRGSFHLSRLWNKVGDKSLKLLKRILLRKLRHVSHYIIWVSSYLPHLHSHFALYLKLTKSKRAHILSKISYIQLVEQVFTLEIQFVEKGKKICRYWDTSTLCISQSTFDTEPLYIEKAVAT